MRIIIDTTDFVTNEEIIEGKEYGIRIAQKTKLYKFLWGIETHKFLLTTIGIS